MYGSPKTLQFPDRLRVRAGADHRMSQEKGPLVTISVVRPAFWEFCSSDDGE